MTSWNTIGLLCSMKRVPWDIRLIWGYLTPVLGPLGGPWRVIFTPFLPVNLLKTTKNPYLPLFYAEIPHFTLEIPINTLVPCRIRVIIGNPSENPQKP